MTTSMAEMGSNSDKSPEQLEREINQTRSHVDDTVRVLVDRLSPGQLVDQGLDYLRRSDVADGARTFAVNLGRAVRDNPVPAVMVATGFLWLAMSNGSRRGDGSIRDSLASMLHQQPLVLGLAGVVIGAVIGAALPATQREDKWMGEAQGSL